MLKERLARLLAASVCLAGLCGTAQAADPYKINVVLPLTGGGSFLGKGQQRTLEAFQALVNKEGGIAGRDVEFVYQDDQSSPQTAVQLVNGVVAQKPAVMIGSSLVAMCNAIAPLLKAGPFDYCLSPGAHPPTGSFQFSTSIDTRDLMDVMVRYFKLRGWTKIAFMTSTDASGQDAERGFDETVKKPENADVTIVERQRFNPTDVSVSAQIERIKSAQPQVFVAWSTGAPIATILKAMSQGGLDVPFATTNGNQTFAQFDQYKDFLPKEVYIPTSVYLAHEGLYQLDPKVEEQQKKFYAAHKAAGIEPDNMAALVWDPANAIIETLRKLGPQATAEEVRASLAARVDYDGVNGIHDFKAVPQRGLTNKNAIVAKWDGAKHNWIPVSRPTGLLLSK
jgi:branched-chain amino acid transport system substrate-binding protein